jgi:ABC-type glycerol-3-phosphate transport system permease component
LFDRVSGTVARSREDHDASTDQGRCRYGRHRSCGTAKVLAFTALSMLPALTLFVLAERRMIGGLTGSVQG